jgi:F-type H+-transporting ATP synthase subunit e
MVSPTVNVVRYSALFTGVFYGIYHRQTLQKVRDQEKEHHAIHERQRLISEAKEAWKRKQEPVKTDSGESLFATLCSSVQRCGHGIPRHSTI